MLISGMDEYLPASPTSFALNQGIVRIQNPPPATKDWPHAPVHRLSENGIYMVTAGTLHKKRLFDSPTKLDLLERLILSLAKQT